MFNISTETAADEGAVESLLDQGFGTDRHSRTVYRLRLGPAPTDLSFVTRGPDGLVATLRFWPVGIDDKIPALLLGPLAVDGALRGRGIGRRLITHGLEAATAQGWRLCLVVGAPAYYAPFGFEMARPWGLTLPGPVDIEQFQVKALGAAGLTGLIPARTQALRPWRSVRCSGMINHPAPPPAFSLKAA